MSGTISRGDELSPGSQFDAALKRLAPSLYELARGDGRHRLREYAVLYQGPGQWMAKVKAVDTHGDGPVILFARGDTPGVALLAASRLVKAGRWKPDKYAGKGWAK